MEPKIRQCVFASMFKLLSLALIFNRGDCQEFTTEPQTVKVMRGSNVTFQCQVTQLGGLNVFWIHERTVLSVNKLVMRSDGRTHIRGRYSLHISNVTSRDEGEYICQLSTVPVMEQVSTLVVTVPAEISEFPSTPEVQTTLGETVNLTCGATGKPAPNITWSREDGGSLPSGASTVDGPTLLLSQVRYDQDGKYTCTAYNGVGTPDVETVHLKVYYPPIIHNETSTIHTGPGADTYLPCLVSAQPEPLVTWYHNETRLVLRDLPQHKEIVVEERGLATDYQLHIRGVQDSDLGSYVCEVSNDRGTTSTHIKLTAVPGRPYVTSSAMGDYSDVYTLKWSVVSYVVPVRYIVMIKRIDNTTETQGEWKEVKAEPTSSGDPSSGLLHGSVTLSHLDHDTSYEIVIKAHNPYGWGERSEYFTFTTNKAGMTAPPTTNQLHRGRGEDSGKNSGGVSRINALLTGSLLVCSFTMMWMW